TSRSSTPSTARVSPRRLRRAARWPSRACRRALPWKSNWWPSCPPERPCCVSRTTVHCGRPAWHPNMGQRRLAPLGQEAAMSEHKVLIPLDGSDFSLQAFRTLARLFEPETTKVTLVHVAPVPEGVPQPILEPIILGATSPWPHLPHKQTLFSSQEWESTRAEVLTAMDDDAQRLSEAG